MVGGQLRGTAGLVVHTNKHNVIKHKTSPLWNNSTVFGDQMSSIPCSNIESLCLLALALLIIERWKGWRWTKRRTIVHILCSQQVHYYAELVSWRAVVFIFCNWYGRASLQNVCLHKSMHFTTAMRGRVPTRASLKVLNGVGASVPAIYESMHLSESI